MASLLPDPRTETPSWEAAIERGHVLLVQHCANFTGSAVSGRLVAEGLIGAGWQVDVAFGFAGPYAARYREIGCATHVVEHKSWLRGGDVFRSARRLGAEFVAARRFVELMRRVRPDVVYVNSLVSLAGAVAARRLGIPCVWHVRELFDDVGGEMRVPAAGGRAGVRWLLRRLADQVVVISEAVAENVLGRERSERVAVVPNAVSAEFFDLARTRRECRELLGLPQGVRIVGVPGTLRPMKGHPYFLEAAARVAGANGECEFAITGDGESGYRSELVAQVERAGLTRRVHFLGSVEEMPSFYRACDVVCVPSRAEPFGRTVIEAYAVGTPVVATAVGGMRETVEDGRTGLLVEYGDVAGLAGSLGRLLGDEGLLRGLAERAREKAEAEYTEDVYHRRINALVEGVCSRVKSRR